jgi:hypothetical protein
MNIIKYKEGKNPVWVFENFISKEESAGIIKMFNNLLESGDFEWHPISFYESYAYNMPHQLTDDKQKIEKWYKDAGLPNNFFENLESKFKSATEQMIGKPAYKISFHSQKWIPGAYAGFHSDNSYDGKPSAFERSRYAGFLYLNDEFEGGALNFKNFDLTIQPKTGMFAIFDGGHENMHEVTTVLKSDRYTVGSFWDDRPEDAYDQETKDRWAEEIRETREKQKVEQEEWKDIRESGKRRTPDGREYDADLASIGDISGN